MTPTSVFIDGKEYIPKPESIDRQKVLRGEHESPAGVPGYVIIPGCEIQPYIGNPYYYDDLRSKGWVFFPTEADAVEYATVDKGEWLPKKGDEYAWAGRDIFGNWQQRDRLTVYDEPYRREGCVENFYAPSWNQLQAILAKQKPKAKAGIGKEHYHALSIDQTFNDEGNTRIAKHRRAFDFLMPICIANGGRFGMPDSEWGVWESIGINGDSHSSVIEVMERSSSTIFPTFHFPVGKANAFLATPGVTDHLEKFFFITHS